MTTLKSLAWQFLDDISGQGVTKDTRFDEREIVLKIRQLMNELLALKLFEKYNEGDRSAISLYIASYELVLAESAGVVSVTLPEFYYSLPYNRGVHRIFFKKKRNKDIVISHNPGVSAGLDAGNVFGEYYASIEGFSIKFRNVTIQSTTPTADKTIVVQLIIAAPDTIGLNDPLPILPEHQNEILKRLRMQYLPTAQDPTNNGNKDS